MFLFILIVVTLFFLVGTFLLTALRSAFYRLNRRDIKKLLKGLGNFFFYQPLHYACLRNPEPEGIFFTTVCAQHITRFCYAAFSILAITQASLLAELHSPTDPLFLHTHWGWALGIIVLLVFLSFLIADFLPRIIAARNPEMTVRICAPASSIFLIATFPIAFLFLKFSKSLSNNSYLSPMHGHQGKIKDEIIELIQEADVGSSSLDPHDKKLIESIFDFRYRLAREVMVPRVDVFSLPANTSIKEAAKLLRAENWSRIPVYRNTVDNIIGVLMYKDILNKYMEFEENGQNPKILQAPIETIVKGVLYTPETKRIPNLLQEFRKKQVHLAIVVDEYGGTEGIVTIEDILEEIVGDIEDEYDEEEALFVKQADGSWIVDARMSISDIEEQLWIQIPQESDYDTIGGYIFHHAGAIPPKGFVIHHDNFELQVISSDDRSIDKIRLMPISKPEEGDHNEESTHGL
jgi:putative hemolysin